MATDDDVQNADVDARKSEDNADQVRQQAIVGHRETADAEEDKAWALKKNN